MPFQHLVFPTGYLSAYLLKDTSYCYQFNSHTISGCDSGPEQNKPIQQMVLNWHWFFKY